jgi:hypothetical protein
VQVKQIVRGLVCGGFFLCACRGPIDERPLYGLYTARDIYKEGVAIERLKLNPDGTYNQDVSLTINDKTEILSTTGTWKYKPKLASVSDYILLKDIFVIRDGLGSLRKDYNKPITGYSYLPVVRELFSRRWCLGDDEGKQVGVQYMKTE